jgi:DNA invertase Pin-like site-specific DNA recombinase
MGYDKRWLPKRAVAYLRISPDRRANRGCSLAVQRRAIDQWAANNNVYIAGFLIDEGEAGEAALQRRPGLAQALAAAAELEDGGLVVYRLDRLDPEPILQVVIERELQRFGSRLYSTDSAAVQPVFDVLLRLPSFQTASNGLRLRVGRLRKHKRGGYAYGAPPTGYRAEYGQLVPDPAEQRILKRVRELRADGASLRSIAAVLTSEDYQTRRGGSWQPTQIARLLKSAGR